MRVGNNLRRIARSYVRMNSIYGRQSLRVNNRLTLGRYFELVSLATAVGATTVCRDVILRSPDDARMAAAVTHATFQRERGNVVKVMQ